MPGMSSLVWHSYLCRTPRKSQSGFSRKPLFQPTNKMKSPPRHHEILLLLQLFRPKIIFQWQSEILIVALANGNGKSATRWNVGLYTMYLDLAQEPFNSVTLIFLYFPDRLYSGSNLEEDRIISAVCVCCCCN
jgi:hypothetical protein